MRRNVLLPAPFAPTSPMIPGSSVEGQRRRGRSRPRDSVLVRASVVSSGICHQAYRRPATPRAPARRAVSASGSCRPTSSAVSRMARRSDWRVGSMTSTTALPRTSMTTTRVVWPGSIMNVLVGFVNRLTRRPPIGEMSMEKPLAAADLDCRGLGRADPVGHDHGLDDRARLVLRCGRRPAREDLLDMRDEGHRPLVATKHDEIRLVLGVRPAAAELDVEGRFEPRRRIAGGIEAA